MNRPYINKFLGMVLEELDKAEEKHPHFCDAFVDDISGVSWADSEAAMKARNEHEPYCANCIQMEEFAEAMNAYQHGDKLNCLKELAQCGAVIMRMMEHVQKEIDNGTHPESHEKKV